MDTGQLPLFALSNPSLSFRNVFNIKLIASLSLSLTVLASKHILAEDDFEWHGPLILSWKLYLYILIIIDLSLFNQI